MGAQRHRVIKQEFAIASYSWNSNTLTINTTGNHLLFNGVNVTVYGENTYVISGTCTVANSTSFSIATTRVNDTFTKYSVESFLPTQTGTPDRTKYSIARGSDADFVIQSFVTGTGGASYNVDVSLDGIHWIPTANIVHSTANNDTTYLVISPGWLYFRPYLNSVGANTLLTIISGS